MQPNSQSFAQSAPARTGEELLTTSQMMAADQMAVAAGCNEFDLMAAAGKAVAAQIAARWAPRPCLVLCGLGNNGGDGFVVARELQARGWSVSLAVRGSRQALKGSAAQHAALWQGRELAWGALDLTGVELVVDAVLGAGLDRDLPADVSDLLAQAKARQAVICAVDVPSGLDGTTGQARGAVTSADLTVTFFRRKPGHVLLPGRELCGEVVVADIGIPESATSVVQPGLWRNAPSVWQRYLPALDRAGHKYDRGHVLVLGGAQMTGAARLAAQAAQRAGAGLVTVAAPQAVWPVYATALQSVMVEPLLAAATTHDGALDQSAVSVLMEDGQDSAGTFSLAAWAQALNDPRRNVALLGPGLGRAPEVRTAVLLALASKRRNGVVLDADAVSVFADEPTALFDQVRGACVMTPHEGEFQRLFGQLQGSKLERARTAARQSGSVVLLKGADTVVAAPDGRAIINDNAPPWLATGGTGDVLAGLVAGLMAQGVEPFWAAALGCWMQGRAAQDLGRGMVADDLLGVMRVVWAELTGAPKAG